MAERKTIATIQAITDCDTGIYQIGEVDGGFHEDELYDYIKKHGHVALSQQLTIMQWKIWETVRKINAEKDQLQSAKLGEGQKNEPLTPPPTLN